MVEETRPIQSAKNRMDTIQREFRSITEFLDKDRKLLKLPTTKDIEVARAIDDIRDLSHKTISELNKILDFIDERFKQKKLKEAVE